MARLEGTEDRGRFTAASGAPGGLGAAAASSAGGARGGRRVPAARSLAPTLLNGFLWLDVYLSFVFAFVSQLLHRRLTATFLSFFAARSWGWRAPPRTASARKAAAPAHPALRRPLAGTLGWGRGHRRQSRGRSILCAASNALHRQNDSGIRVPPHPQPRGPAFALGASLPRLRWQQWPPPSAPRGHVKCWQLDRRGRLEHPDPQTFYDPGGLWSVP